MFGCSFRRAVRAVALPLLLHPVLAAASTCPISTRVSPFSETDLPRYRVQLEDGGPGDLDGVANGACETMVRSCIGTAGCDAVPLDRLKLNVGGRPRGVAAELAERLTAELARVSSAQPFGRRGLRFASPESGLGRCAETPVRLPAGGRLSLRTKGYTVPGNVRPRAGRVAVECAPAGDVVGPLCRSSTLASCPPLQTDACGNGRVDQDAERCDGADDGACPGACRADCRCALVDDVLNVAAFAASTASSERAPGGFASAAIDGVVDGLPGAPGYEWASNGQTAGAMLRLDWNEPVRIDRIVLHDRPSLVDNVESATLLFDDGSAVPIGALPPDGRPVEIMVAPRLVLALTFIVRAASGTDAGLGEIAVMAAADEPTEPTDPTDPPDPTDPTDPTDPEPPPPAAGRTYYLSPGGSDGAAGTSVNAPWRSFAKVFRSGSPLAPGDTVVLLDGTYTRTTTGLPRIDCKAGGNAPNGRAGAPITLRAQNERRAHLSSDGQQAGFEMRNCAWWRVEGLRASSKDASAPQSGGYPFRVDHVQDVELRRLLGSHNNRRENTHVYAIENSQRVLVEECEAHFFHRHGFSVWRSRYVTLRRCYANSRRWGEKGCCSGIDNRAYGDEAFSLYGTSDSIIENSVSDDFANGFQIHGIASPLDPSGSGGRNNRILGSMSLGDAVPLLVSSRVVSGKYHNARGNVVRDFVAADMQGHGAYLRGSAGTVVENSTLYRSKSNSGLMADAGDSGFGGTCGGGNAAGCGLVVRNLLSLDHAGQGIAVTGFDDWLVEWSNAAGSGRNWASSENVGDGSGRIRHSQSVADGRVGLGAGKCLVRPPAGSPFRTMGQNGGAVGASIVNRYRDGALTTTPLWERASGAFPCGAVVAGVNDGGTRCTNFHQRIGVTDAACGLR